MKNYHLDVKRESAGEVEGLDWSSIMACPICHDLYNHFREFRTIDSEDDYKAAWGGRGDLQILTFNCESGHEWELCIGFHKGYNYIFCRAEQITESVNYREYIVSQEWKEKADAAKERAGYRCQVCNSPDNLNAHHRTYENLGHEKPEDLFVLCQNCHEIFYINGKLEK
jgi:hypothetical protein